ncbi:hypothetical protein [Vibrio owensii]|uniref:hypothetical protein n=1 Tax=Vibrio owensii TaxID=696485 RepID=UPI0040679AAB
MKKITLFTALTSVLLVGCSSSPLEQHAKHQKKVQDQREERVEEVLDNIPSWYVSVPQATEMGFYAAGTSSSKKLSFAVSKAKMQAELELAKQYQQLVSASERSFTRETGDGEDARLQSEAEQTIDKLVAEADLSGYEVVDSKLLKEGSTFRSYVLVFMPYDSNNRIKNSRSESTRQAAQQAYDDLNRRVAEKTAKLEVE